ncbi:MAG: arylesterase [Proteobacteria bacterium]|nr:arylesterase [Pseudomonadota bacterium]
MPRWRAALAVLLALAACDSGPPRLVKLPADGVVLAFGDSLTFGTGARAEASYPAVLEELIGRRVVRAGVPGEVTAQGLARLPGALRDSAPDLLVLIHGGNDVLQRRDREDTRANLRAMVQVARERGVAVVLIGVPNLGLILGRSAGFYQALAEELDLPYDGEALPAILKQSGLKSDPIHPNAQGYRQLAEAVAELLRRSGAI